MGDGLVHRPAPAQPVLANPAKLLCRNRLRSSRGRVRDNGTVARDVLYLREEVQTLIGTVLLVVLILLLLGALPTWPHSKSWGYAPSGTLGTVLLIVLILVVMGRI